MKYILHILFLLVLCCPTIQAQKVNETEVIRKINSVASAMKTMQCDFVQTKTLKLLNDKMVSRGKMYYQQSDKLRWEYTTPYSYTFILNGQKVQINQGKRSDVIDVNQSKLFKEIARIMMNSVVGKSLSDKKDFQVAISSSSTEWIATLTPQRREMKQMFKKIILHFSKSASMVSTVELVEKKGDTTVIQLKNVKKNQSIHAGTFTIR